MITNTLVASAMKTPQRNTARGADMSPNFKHLTTLVLLCMLSVCGCRKFLTAIGASLVLFTNVENTIEVSDETSRLVVTNRVGDVTIKADPEATVVHVQVAVKINEERVATAEKGTFEDHVRITEQDGAVVIQDAHIDTEDEKDWSLVMTVRVPARLAVEINNGVGDILVENTTAGLKLVTGVGDMRVNVSKSDKLACSTGVGDLAVTVGTVGGKVKLDSGTGDVSLAVTQSAPSKDVTISAGVGDISLLFPLDAPGNFSLETTAGKIDLGPHSGVEVARSGTTSKANGTRGEGGPDYKLATGLGNIGLK
jgi:hypothetical protein